ncbi:UNVERIFIED_CONTAM: hypothetical protein RMT77_003596 [Armadillidium vulgare]
MRMKIILIFGVLNIISNAYGTPEPETTVKLSIGSHREIRHDSPHTPSTRDSNRTVVVVNPGDSAKLDCPIPSELFGTKVSWIRRRDFQLLSVGEAMYANDNRFFVSHSRHSHYQGSRHSQVWFLHLRNVTDSDEGEYECQTSNHPHVSTISYLKVQSAFSLILGPPERVVAAGSELQLVCSFKNSSKPLSYLFWYQENKMINYDISRGIVVSTGTDVSTLTIHSSKAIHAGNYTCEPSNAAPSSVIVHVVEENTDLSSFHPGTDEGFSSPDLPKNGPNSPSGSSEQRPSDTEKTRVRQLGVKSASSTSPKSISEGVFPSLIYLGIISTVFMDKCY